MKRMTVRDIDNEISALEQQIQQIKELRGDAEKSDKRLNLLTNSFSSVRSQVAQMSNDDLAKKCRFMTLIDILNMINKELELPLSFPLEISGKTIAELVFISDFFGDNEKLNALEIKE